MIWEILIIAYFFINMFFAGVSIGTEFSEQHYPNIMVALLENWGKFLLFLCLALVFIVIYGVSLLIWGEKAIDDFIDKF